MNGFTRTVAIGALIVAGAARAGDEVKAIYSQSCYSNGDWLGKSANWNAEGTHPNAETDYVVDHGSAVRIGSNQAYTTFAGKSLRLGTAGGSDGAFILNTTCSSSYPFSVSGVGGLILERGYFRAWNTVSSLAEQTSREYLSGDIHVTSTATAPFRFMAERTNMTWGIRGTLLGDATACLKVEPYNVNNFKQSVELYGDCSNYLGELDVCDTIGTTTVLLGGDFGGSLTVPSRGIITFKEAGVTSAQVVSLTLAEGAVIEYAAVKDGDAMNRLVVTDALQFGGKIRIRISNSSALARKKYLAEAFRWPIFSAPKGSGVKLSDIEIADPDVLRAFGIKMEFADDAEGRPTLTLVRTPVDVLTAVSKPPTDSFTGAGLWQSGNAPDPNWAYYSGNKEFRTLSSVVNGASGEATFAGCALAIDNSFVVQMRKVTVPVLTLLDEGGVYHWYGSSSALADAVPYAPKGTKHMCGDLLYVCDGTAVIGVNSSDYAFLFHLPIAGPGNVEMKHSVGEGLNSYLEFLGDNSRWTGKQLSTVTLDAEKRPTAQFANTGYLRINGGTSLGGELTTFTHDALTLSGGMILWPYPGVTLGIGTRGVLVSGGLAGIKVDADDVFTLNETVTLGANLHKLGEGRFVLGGGAMQFCTDAAPTPVAMPTDGYNDISVDAGSLEVSGVTAVDGASISFASGTKLVVKIPAADDMSDFSKYGYRNVKVDDPITFADAKLTIGFDASAVQPAERDIPLFTVSATAASALDGKLMCVKPYGGHRVTAIAPRPNDDGSVTFVATVEQQGLMLLFR